MLPKINPTQTKAWKGLNEYFAEKNFDLRSFLPKILIVSKSFL